MSYDEALATVLDNALVQQDTIEVPIDKAKGMVLAEPILANIAVPADDNSAMDGYAVRTIDAVSGAILPVEQRIVAGDEPFPHKPGTASRIFTGALLPEGADAILLQEDTESQGDHCIRCLSDVRLGQHIRRVGDDIPLGHEVLLSGKRLRPIDIGLLASLGISKILVYRPLRIALLSSGNELLDPGEPYQRAKVYNSNRYLLREIIKSLGMDVIDLGHIADDLNETTEKITEAAAIADCIISTGGMSVGEEDHVRRAVAALGRVHFWKVAIKPGKPIAMASVQGVPFFGLPGNPVSAYVTFFLFVRPWLQKSQGLIPWANKQHYAVADFDVENKSSRRDFRRGNIRLDVRGNCYATLWHKQSSAVLTSLACSNALIVIPERTSVRRGQRVLVLPLDN